jgi:hypothetical protein
MVRWIKPGIMISMGYEASCGRERLGPPRTNPASAELPHKDLLNLLMKHGAHGRLTSGTINWRLTVMWPWCTYSNISCAITQWIQMIASLTAPVNMTERCAHQLSRSTCIITSANWWENVYLYWAVWDWGYTRISRNGVHLQFRWDQSCVGRVTTRPRGLDSSGLRGRSTCGSQLRLNNVDT